MQLFGNKSHLNSRIAEWIKGSLEGDRKSQKALYDALSDKMYAVCLRYMGDRELAQDILQDGFVTLFSKLGSYTGEGSFEGWARKIFVNTALMSLRKNDVLKQSDEVEEAFGITSSDPTALQQLSYMELLKYISELPPGFRTVFNLFAVEGYSHKEIAEQLEISEATSRSQLLRARALLQTKIKNRN